MVICIHFFLISHLIKENSNVFKWSIRIRNYFFFEYFIFSFFFNFTTLTILIPLLNRALKLSKSKYNLKIINFSAKKKSKKYLSNSC